VSTTSIHMSGSAAQWFQSFKHVAGAYQWEEFARAVVKEFEVDTHRSKTMQLLNLQQSGSVDEYQKSFEQLVYNIGLFDHSLSETLLTSQFLLGLKDDIRSHVEMMLPDCVAKAATLAAIQEHMSEKVQKGYKPVITRRLVGGDKADNKGATELWQARQLREYRRANKLCYKCGDKYVPNHTCVIPTGGNLPAQLSVLATETSDGGGFISDEVLNLLEQHPEEQEHEGYLSLNAILGAQSCRVIHLRALVGNQVLSMLVDLGSSNTFLNSSMLSRISYTSYVVPALKVKVANGQILYSIAEVKDLEWWIQGQTFCTPARVLDIGAHDMILGMDWLEQHSPMQCDWANKSITFLHLGKQVTLQGIQQQQVDQLTEISGKQLLKLQKGNDLWALVVLTAMNDSSHQQ
jgi:hypothetical protein